MKLLLDTCTLVWMLRAAPEMPREIKTLIEGAASLLHVSLVSAWEIAIKTSCGKLQVGYSVEPGLRRILEKASIPVLVPGWEEIGAVQRLHFHHRDPFDRMLVSQALHHGLAIVSPDAAFDDYGVRRVWSNRP